MKTIYLVISGLMISLISSAQIVGSWERTLDFGVQKLRLVVNIKIADYGELQATLDSPDQGARGIPISSITFNNDTLSWQSNIIGASFTGVLRNDSVLGTFSQNGMSFPLNLIRKSKLSEQSSIDNNDYISENIVFENQSAGIKLVGTLTKPKNTADFPTVILISGSGPQNRDEEAFGHKPFLTLADYLTRNSIAVLRCDDRGTGESEGFFPTASASDLLTDTETAINYLRNRNDINQNQIGLIGHSEGGLTAIKIAAKDKNIRFVVLMATPGVAGDSLLLLQNHALGKTMGMDDKSLANANKLNKAIYQYIKDGNSKLDSEEFNKIIRQISTDITDEEINQLTAQLPLLASPWMKEFLTYNPIDDLKKIACPTLILNGEKDLQVPCEENVSAIENALRKGGNLQYKIVKLPEHNHLFQKCESGLPTEYGTIKEDISDITMQAISIWIESLK